MRSRPLLLVEDKPQDALTIKRALAELGMAERTIHAPTAGQALEYLRCGAHEKPALILLEFDIGGMSGLEFLRAVKSDPTLRAIPVVVLASSQDRRDILQSFDLHAAGYIVKPFDDTAALEALKIIQEYWSLSYLPACHA